MKDQSKAIVGLVGFCALILGACLLPPPPGRAAPVPLPTRTVPVLDIHEPDGGGDIEAYRVAYQMFERAGYRARVGAECVSACVLVFAIFPTERVCVSEKARLGMHLASGSRGPDRGLTAFLMKKYPQWLQDETAALGRLERAPKWITFETLRKHVAVC